MNRRRFIRDSALTMAGTLAASLPARATRLNPAQRPNLLIITTDQQSAEAMSAVDNGDLRTPAMDSLAAEGVMFERAYCANPICVPSRASYMTGLMPHENGVRYNADTFPEPMRGACWAESLRAAGYATAYIGKWHIPRAIEDSAWSGFERTALTEANGVDPAIADAAEAFLRSDHGGRPFLLCASFHNPHDICEWARSASGIEDRLPNGPIPEAPPPDRCPVVRANHAVPVGEPAVIRAHQAAPGNARTYPVRGWGGPEDGRWRQYLWAYYRLTEKVDAGIGRILDCLRQSGQAEHTLVVFFSDHGDGMGAHRWNQKTLFYDECARVPFIVSWPGQTWAGGRERKRLVNLGTDLAATLFDFAGIPASANSRGKSVKAFALGRRDGPVHPYVVSEANLHPAYGAEGEHNGRMVRSARYKYIGYNGGADPEQLFDLDLDPGEMHNLVHDPAHADVLAAHRRMLAEYARDTADDFPVASGKGV